MFSFGGGKGKLHNKNSYPQLYSKWGNRGEARASRVIKFVSINYCWVANDAIFSGLNSNNIHFAQGFAIWAVISSPLKISLGGLKTEAGTI